MRNSNLNIDEPPPVIDDQINFHAETIKNSLESFGGVFTAAAVTTGVAQIKKAGKAAGLSDAEANTIGESENPIEAVGNVVRVGVGRAADAVRGATDRLRNLGRTAQEQVEDNLPKAPVELQNMAGRGGDAPAPDSTADYPRIRNDAPQDEPSTAPESAPPDVAPDVPPVEAAAPAATEEVASAGADVGEDVLEGLGAAAKASAAADFDPVNLAITAALGLATTIGGLFIRVHHTKDVSRHIPQNIVGFGSTLGAS
tara:strand:- start:430 stop:1197 length:768 start_codon:yes stop_codon:yes gene_type:complete